MAKTRRPRRRCERCKRPLPNSAFKNGGPVCRGCVNAANRVAAIAAARAAAATAVVPAPVFPTVDLLIGQDVNGMVRRRRLVRVQRVGSLIRLLAGVQLDATAVQVIGTFTVPLARVGALQHALTQIAAPAR